jgi:protein-histidine pros-kinase
MVMAALVAERRNIDQRLRATRENLILARGEDLQRIARWLHGDVVQRLTLAGLSVDELRADCTPSGKAALDKLYEQISSVSDLTRNLSHDLHPFALEYLGLSRALSKLCREASEQNAMTVNFSEQNVPARLPAAISVCLFRVAQGALSQIARQGHAKTVAVELRTAGKQVLLRIGEKGGVSFQPSEGTEWTWMREGVLSLGGTLRVASASSDGALIEAFLPLQSAS